ncbi:MAG: M24 family metallopeptidase, partial [Bacteroides sp.]|nr:M24 family metallopeptidase [Bacteroides sp.]
PGGYVLKEGDIVSVDVGAYYKGFHGDCAATYACGAISAEAQKLIDVLSSKLHQCLDRSTCSFQLPSR